MQKVILSATLLVVFCFFSASGQIDYKVQITALDRSVPINYFGDLTNVEIVKDHNDIYRIYQGEYSSLEEANAAAEAARKKGYKYARVIDLEEIRQQCTGTCSPYLYVQNIFFDFDKDFLRPKSKRDLNTLSMVLSDNPAYKVVLSAHTDSRGSNSYNVDLSKRRARSAEQYLLAKGISASRISVDYKGELQPIAKNELAGQDSPQGRQYNRRVVITLLDKAGNVVPNVVTAIDVPSTLKN